MGRLATVFKWCAISTGALLFASGTLVPQFAAAERSRKDLLADFPVPHGFADRVGFWRDIFTKYGKFHRVFHHREHPEIIYSVLDFSELEDDFAGKKLETLREQAIEEEVDRIQKMLRGFAAGDAPKNAFEKRLVTLFKEHTSGDSDAYEYAMDLKMIRNQSGIRERFRDGLVRSGRYLYAIERIFANQGLPLGLARLPLVESSFDYRAYSSVGAAGIWQFTRSTGARYMRVSSAIDERRDPIVATRAAASYLRNAYNRTQNWGLAVTSYNHGLQGILNAANQTGSRDLGDIVRSYKGSGFGFASSNFYAEFLAALEVDQHAEKYFPDLRREGPWYFDEIRIGRAARLADIGRATGIPRDELADLNLAFGTPITKGGGSIPAGTIVKVPPGKGKVLMASIASSTLVGLGHAEPNEPPVAVAEYQPGPRAVAQAEAPAVVQPVKSDAVKSASFKESPAPARSAQAKPLAVKTYTVGSGESIGGIAKKLGVPPKELMAINGITDPKKIRAGKSLKVPASKSLSLPKEPALTKQDAASGGEISTSKEVIVMRGDSPVDEQRLPKGDRPLGEALEQPMKESKSSRLESGGAQPQTQSSYVVKSGDTLGSIASSQGLTLKQLLAANPSINPTKMKPGVKLRLPGASDAVDSKQSEPKPQAKESGTKATAAIIEEETAKPGSNPGSGPIAGDMPIQTAPKSEKPAQSKQYVVGKGDTVQKIAKKVGMSTQALLDLNPGIDPKKIRPGAKLAVK